MKVSKYPYLENLDTNEKKDKISSRCADNKTNSIPLLNKLDYLLMSIGHILED